LITSTVFNRCFKHFSYILAIVKTQDTQWVRVHTSKWIATVFSSQPHLKERTITI
jgi:hypothetical protein